MKDTNFNVNESNHQIYGGADPLENTQPVSLSDINNAVNSAEPIAPKSPVEEIPQAEVLTNNENSVSTTTEAPMVMPIQGDTPVVSSSESIDNPINPVQSMSESNVEAPNVAPTITEPTVNVLDTPQVQPIQDTSEVNSAIPVVSSNNM